MLTYVPRFRDKVFVLALDGEIVAQENFSNILLDLAVLRSLNIRVVIVHGTAHQIRQLSKQTGQKISNDDGTGVTDEATLNLAITASNRVTHDIMEGLASSDLRACYASAIIAHPFGIVGGVDHLCTGRVDRVDTDFLVQLLEKDIIPIIPPLGFDGEGRTFRVNSDSIALEVARGLKAVKLLYLTPHRGLLKQKQLIHQLSVEEAEKLLQNRAEMPAVLSSKLEHAIAACREGVGRVHIIDGREDEALLTEVFSNEGVGTMIYINEYQQVRRAMKKDVSSILSLIKKAVFAEEMVKRTRAEIAMQISDYFVFEIDRNIVGCVAVHLYPATNQAELACLCVASGHENQGIGSILTQYAETVAREKSVKQLITLSTHAFNFFQQKGGFIEATADILPPERRHKYDASGRKSKVLYKNLG
jgi:amino-acid N-acetyltransferase